MKEELDYRAWIIKFLSGEISESELDSLKSWLREDPANRRIFDEENELWQELGIKTKQKVFKVDDAWSDLSTKLGLKKDRKSPVVVMSKNNVRLLKVAASIAFLVALGGLSLWLTERRSDKQVVASSTSVCVDEGEKASVFLTDSTQVILNSGSTLTYATDYNNKERVVKLSGEAFFEVRTNPEKPFVVQLGQMSVSATGTRFNISSYCYLDRIEATLEEGAINVFIKGKEPIISKPGQQVVYFTKTDKVVIRDVATEIYTSWKENKLRLIDTPFKEALRKIALRYNVTFEIRGHDLLELKYTATFIDESIEDVMKILKAVSPIEYKIYRRSSINNATYIKPKIIVEMRKPYS